jgi:hypothetical protein
VIRIIPIDQGGAIIQFIRYIFVYMKVTIEKTILSLFLNDIENYKNLKTSNFASSLAEPQKNLSSFWICPILRLHLKY